MIFPFFNFVILLTLPFWPYGTGRPNAEIKKTSLEFPAKAGDFENIRIAVLTGTAGVTVSSTGSYTVKDSKGQELFHGPRLSGSRIEPADGGIRIGNQVVRDKAVLIESSGGSFRIGEKTYRDALILVLGASGKLTVINQLTIDDYLRGVLPVEANPNWSMEALKAQAIVSRTYALFKAMENQKQHYQLSSDVLSQVYAGKRLENPRTNQAIDETRGLVLSANGKIFPAYFHSTCGGRTTQAEYIWDVDPHPSLRGVTCTFCAGSKHYRWTAEFTLDEIEKRLKQRGAKVPGIRNVRLAEKDASGRVRGFWVDHSAGSTLFHSNDFRIWMDPMKLKSTMITGWERRGRKILARGKGWGHGVGLCQYGTKHLGEMGYTSQQILKYYFPGAQVVNRTDYLRTESPAEESQDSGRFNLLNMIKEYL